MNKILSLLDGDFVSKYFEDNVLPLYPQIKEVSDITIRPYKKLVWEDTYHAVISFNVKAVTHSGKNIFLPIVCSAHSSEPRELSFKALKYLWDNHFANDEFIIPRPLFFDKYFNASFYRAVRGNNLLRFIKDGNLDHARDLIEKSAKLFVRLHEMPQLDSFEFNHDNARVETVIPGRNNSVREVKERFGQELSDRIAKLYDMFIAQEDAFRKNIKLSIIHGDAHTENIIRAGKKKVGLIDFTDFSLSDRFRDVGSFLQQLEHKVKLKVQDDSFSKECKDIFISSYLKYSGIELDDEIQSRINLYYNWTSIRTVVFWLLKYDPSPEKAITMLDALERRAYSDNFKAQD